jgi:manganese transport protein
MKVQRTAEEGGNEGDTHTGMLPVLKKWLLSLGPGIITAALVFGPSKITIITKLGAEYGYTFLWIIILAIFFMAIFTSMSARIGIATSESLLTTIRQKWGRVVGLLIGTGVFLVCASFQAGNSIGIGIALGEMTGTPVTQWIIIFNIVGIGLLFFRTFYKVLEKMMILLVSLMLFAFLTTVALIRPHPDQIVSGLEPRIPSHSLGLVIAFFASSFSIVGAFYQAYLVQERKRINPKRVQTSTDSLPGILMLGLMSVMVMICAAGVLFPAGIRVNKATDMARALEPLFGNYASRLFLCGLFASSFSALIGNATLGGTLLGDAMGYGHRLTSKVTKSLIALVMIIGALVAIIFGKVPLQFIILAQSLTILIVPFIGLALFTIANNRQIMGSLKNSTAAQVFGAMGLMAIIILAVQNVREMFFK